MGFLHCGPANDLVCVLSVVTFMEMLKRLAIFVVVVVAYRVHTSFLIRLFAFSFGFCS